MLTLDDLDAAYGVVRQFAVHTPLLESPLLNHLLGFRLLVKAECLQTTGAFKLRGAYHLIATLPKELRKHGVVAFSSGNHAQAVAYVARHFGIKATIIMPDDAPAIKRTNTQKYGAEVILYNRVKQDREQVAHDRMRDHPATLIKPFDDPKILLGQGTAALEALADCHALPTRMYIPCSGAGLLAGSSLAASRWGVTVTACEPQGFNSAGCALRDQKISAAYTQMPDESRLCDALLSPVVGEHCFPIIAKHVDEAQTVQEHEVLHAMHIAFHYFKLVVEPGGAAGLAVALRQKNLAPTDCLLAMCSGGNVDPAIFARAISTDISR